MKQILLWAGLFILAACTSSTNGKQETTSPHPASGLTDKDKEFFQKVTVNAYESFNKGDRAPYIDRYSPNAFYMAPNLETLKGKEAIREFILTYPSIHVEFPIEEILGTSNHVNIRGTYVINDTTGKFLDKGKYVSIWQKDTARNWVLTHDIYNSDVSLQAGKK
jgi:ketosteroid isomerase-like protein